MNTVCVLLAAGSSSRMQLTGKNEASGGVAKMLLEINGKTLLQHVIDEVKQLEHVPLLVVTGCYHSILSRILTTQQIDFVYNQDWEEGMGTSIQKAITCMEERFPETDNAMILVCDQPYISSGLLKKMTDATAATGKGIVACNYNNTAGTPVLFHKNYFNRLKELHGQHGAKKIIQLFDEDVFLIDFPEGAIDIDTPKDYQVMKSRKNY